PGGRSPEPRPPGRTRGPGARGRRWPAPPPPWPGPGSTAAASWPYQLSCRSVPCPSVAVRCGRCCAPGWAQRRTGRPADTPGVLHSGQRRHP
ncbi:hypothetical protein GPJ59_29805, partial [Streptomyces bambusae]|nr:hypothetical protein [Streptomyces bambusae]